MYHSSFPIFHNFLPNPARILQALTYNGSEPLNVNVGMTKSTFQLAYDKESGICYIKKKEDEMTQNHRERDTGLITGFILQILDADGTPHRLCPVRSFENYINYLNPKCQGLWQKPNRRNIQRGVQPYFDAVTIGKNQHVSFMSDLSEKLELSTRYTNHSIRVTGTTNLTRAPCRKCTQFCHVQGGQ